MKLTFAYYPDPAVDALCIYTERRWVCGDQLPEHPIVIHSGVWEESRDIAGVEILWAANCMAPYFQLSRDGAPFKAGHPELSRYDRETDTLTWGNITDDPEMVSQAGDLTAYWQPEEDPAEDEPFFDPIGLSLRNAAKHLAPHFVRVEPAAG